MTWKKRKLIFIAGIILLVIAAAYFGAFLTPHDPYATDLGKAFLKPSLEYPFGTDNLGRCIFSRVLAGAKTSLLSALFIVTGVFLIGTTIGAVAGFMGGKVDRILMEITVVVQAFPSFVLAVAIAGILGAGLQNAILSLMIMYWTTYARLSRSLVLQIRNEEYVKAAKMCGAKKRHILFKYILPNAIPSLIVAAALDVGSIILNMAGLSFLGLGAQAPMIEWGMMISSTRNFLQTAPWCILFPSAALFAAVIIFNLAGDGLRDCLDVTEER